LALDWLQKAYDERDLGFIYMQAPEFRRVLEDEPRYQELRHRLKLGAPLS
jgi:hypothetical protein